MKAFLSHSSSDKEFVKAVANELGHQYCVFDEQAFLSGIDFKESIEQGLDESSVLVLFASKAALDSIWVDFELDKAWYKKMLRSLKRSIVYIIDSNVAIDDIPKWLSQGKIVYQNVALSIARDIRMHLDDVLRNRQHPFFIGRSEKIEELQNKLTPTDGSILPRSVFIFGIPSIGRRTFTRHTTKSMLNLKKYVEINIGEGDSVNDICTRIADRIEPYSTKVSFKAIVNEIQNLSKDHALDRSIEDLHLIVESGELPILIDDGGILDSDGYVTNHIKVILDVINSRNDIYLFIVTKRNPKIDPKLNIPCIYLGPLNEKESKSLLLTYAKSLGIPIITNHLNKLTEYIGGYPPAAYYAINQIRNYGVDIVLNEKDHLIRFRKTALLRYLLGLELGDKEKRILQILSFYSPLPLIVIQKALDISSKELINILINLIDLALIETTPDGYYIISEPIIDAILDTYGMVTVKQNKIVAKTLNTFIDANVAERPILELLRLQFKAARLAHDAKLSSKAIYLATDLLKLVEINYRNREYREVINISKTLLRDRPGVISARKFLIRALIREEKWKEAEQEIVEIEKYAPDRESSFLRGYMYRQMGQFNNAIKCFEKALREGRKGADIQRELANSYLMAGELESASMSISVALKRQPDNPYFIDLWVKISTMRNDNKSAEEGLGRLKLISAQRYNYRKARYELRFGNQWAAVAHAKRAFEEDPYLKKPRFEVLTTLIYCEIETDELNSAKNHLIELGKLYKDKKQEVQLGLNSKYAIKTRRYKRAIELSEKMEKRNVFYNKIRIDALQGELRTSALNDEQREKYKAEIAALLEEIKDKKPDDFIPEDILV